MLTHESSSTNWTSSFSPPFPPSAHPSHLLNDCGCALELSQETLTSLLLRVKQVSVEGQGGHDVTWRMSEHTAEGLLVYMTTQRRPEDVAVNGKKPDTKDRVLYESIGVTFPE